MQRLVQPCIIQKRQGLAFGHHQFIKAFRFVPCVAECFRFVDEEVLVAVGDVVLFTSLGELDIEISDGGLTCDKCYRWS